MKNLVKTLVLVVAFSSGAAFAADKEVTLTGEGKCAKCALKKADKCQNVVEVKMKDETKVYYLTGDVSQAFHSEICSKTKKVEVTGVSSETDGKHMLAVSKIKSVE